MTQGHVTGVSVAHDRASVADIETIGMVDQRTVVERLLVIDGVTEAFAVSTCNRAEAYVVTTETVTGRSVLRAELPALDVVDAKWMDHEGALRHLLRVGAGLESMVLGEDEILGQLRSARDTANVADGLGPILGETVAKAIRVGERARTETGINDGVRSLGRAAVAVADEQTAVSGRTALVVGAGDMGETVAQAFCDSGADRVFVCNRTRRSAESLVAEVSGTATARDFDAIDLAISEADVVVSATGSPSAIIDTETVAGAGETLLIDIAQPRDVVPAVDYVDEIELFDLDALEARMAASTRQREDAAAAVETIVEEELNRLRAQLKRNQADAVIGQMYEGAAAVKQRELQTALGKLNAHDELDETQREIVEAMADAIVGQLMAAPTKSLREAAEREDWATIQTALQLFDPEFADGAVDTDTPQHPGGTSDVSEDA